ncbi:hypothetical protein [Vitiosangium sp. GDMCC 1.1324]|uniref:hypothetical protein n=1 Tax=Vitiosangium sp. (strain GDMCC 1.1324) TaxID=2138576 RepID=UPI0018EE85B3|nr:hypothetical protein [Vitiosangium sp. GDMCC 1.1324]
MDTNIARHEAATARHIGPPLLMVAGIYVALFLSSLIASTLMAGGGHFPSPFEPEALSRAYFAEHGDAVRMGGFLQFCCAVPLGIFGATVVSRLRFLGVDVAGVSIALFGGLGAALMLFLSAMAQWTLGQPGIADAPGVVRMLHLLAFASGGPGYAVLFGLLVAGVSVSAGLTRRLPRWLMWFGLGIAIAAELSALSLVFQQAAYLLPLARFPGFVWLLCVSTLLPRTRPSRGEASFGGARHIVSATSPT